MNVCILSSELKHTACAQLRLLAPLRRLAPDVRVYWLVESNGREARVHAGPLKIADVVVVQRFFLSKLVEPLLEKVLSLRVPVVYETDDLPWDTSPGMSNRVATDSNEIFKSLVAQASFVSVSTAKLAERIQALNPNVTVLPNLLDNELWPSVTPYKTHDRVRIGFTGTPTHAQDLELVEEALSRLSERRRNAIEFVFMGCATDRMRALSNARFVPFTPDYARYARTLPLLALDIGLAPLLDSPFNQVKSDVKWLEYGICGAAGIFSNVGQYADTIQNGVSGIIVGNNPSEWLDALDNLVGDAQTRMNIATASKQSIMAHRTLRTGWQPYHEFYARIGASRPHRPETT